VDDLTTIKYQDLSLSTYMLLWQTDAKASVVQKIQTMNKVNLFLFWSLFIVRFSLAQHYGWEDIGKNPKPVVNIFSNRMKGTS
jgi:hypothetical protein